MTVDRLNKFGYPAVINSVIDEFTQIVTKIFYGQDIGVLLIGSAARGELCWDEVGGAVVVFSDIEFIVAVDDQSNVQRVELLEEVKLLEGRYQLGSRFHIDYGVMGWPKLLKVEKRILIFDSKNSGIELLGKSVKSQLPEVTLDNLNFKELNDVLLHRMKAIMLDFSEGALHDEYSKRDFILSIAKNSLDITTWLFPYEAKELVTGFENRISIWKEDNNLKLTNYLGEEFSFLTDCLAIRKHPSGSYDVNNLLDRYVIIYTKAIEYCCYVNNLNNNDISSYKGSSALFFEYSLKRRIKEAYLILRNYKIFGLHRALLNIFMPRKGRQIDFCFEMIKSLNLYLNEGFSDGVSLDDSWEKLTLLRKVRKQKYSSFLEEWFAIRKYYSEINEIFI